MRLAGDGATLRRGLTVLAALALVGVSTSPPPRTTPSETSTETRALWVLRTSLASPDSIATLIHTAREHGFNTLLVQVRGRGDAYFTGGLEPRAVELQRQPASFDPLATVLASAHEAGLRVHAWINLNLVSSAADLPIAPTHIIHRHPGWLMVPRELAQELARVKEESPAYVGKLARWTRTQTNEIEGLYASPIIPAAADHVNGIVRDLVTRYDLDGVHLDYARYPGARFDYSLGAIREFRESLQPRLTASTRRDLDARESKDLFVYPDMFPEAWKAFRISRLTALIARLRTTIKTARATTLLSVATAPDLQEAREHRMQDWERWLQDGLVDAVCPMAYTPEPTRFAEQITAARDVAGGRFVWAGIGAYRLPAAQTIENIETARRLGAAGIVLFSYDSLIDPRQSSPDYIALVGRSAFARPAASAGTR
jgi:uncharacterized lipoprotein YddW (UPF0748 family)